MMKHIIHEKNNKIPNKKNLFTCINNSSPNKEYSLNHNFFDPSKSSPPNEFMIKLYMRNSKYNEENANFIKK